MKLAPASLSVLALAMATSACPNPHPSEVAPSGTRDTWRASEDSLKAAAARMPTLAAPTLGASFDVSRLGLFLPSERHGAGDQRHLSRVDGGHVVSDGPVARIVAVKGIEYKTENDFRASPYPIAIIYMDSTPGAADYPKLGLKPGTNYWIVQRVDTGWVGWVQPVAAHSAAYPIGTYTPPFDRVQPVTAARFVWLDTDENLWGWCGGRCCTSGQRPAGMM